MSGRKVRISLAEQEIVFALAALADPDRYPEDDVKAVIFKLRAAAEADDTLVLSRR